jgi:serine protease inhibitor
MTGLQFVYCNASAASTPPSLDVDRPFIFIIRDRLSGTILFMGKMNSIP